MKKAAFILPLVILVVMGIASGVYPFGERCILHMDMYHQYCPFFVEFAEKLQNGGSLLYSWNLGLGSDFISLYAYYLASPLNWLLVLCPKQFVIEFMTILIWLKIAGSGYTFYLFVEKHFRLEKKHEPYALVFALAYAFSGFVCAYSWDIMWMDSILLFPLIMLGLEQLVKEKKVGLYSITLALSIFSNYYISIMICMFVVMYFFFLILKRRKDVVGSTVRFTVYSFLSGAISAVLLLPEIVVLSASGSSGSFPETMKFYFDIVAELTRSCVVTTSYVGNDHWPNLYAGVFTLVLVVLYLLNEKIAWKQKVAAFLLMFFFWVSFANNWLDYIWHGFHFPQGLPGRQSFLYIFVLLCMGFAVVKKWKGVRIWHPLVAIVVLVGLLVWGAFKVDPKVTEDYAMLITGLFVLLYSFLIVAYKAIYKTEEKYVKYIKTAACLIAIAELIINLGVTGFYTTGRTFYMDKYRAYEALADLAYNDAVESAGSDVVFYRTEDTQRKSKNDGALHTYSPVTIFSSLMNLDVSHFYQKVYMEGGKNYYCNNGATPLFSALLSVQYTYSESAKESGTLRSLVGAYEDQYLYKNNYCLPLGTMLPYDLEEDWNTTDYSKIDTINRFAKELGASNRLLSAVLVEQVSKDGMTEFILPADGIYYAAYDECEADTLTFTINGERRQKYSKTTHRYLFEIGECKASDKVTVTNTKSDKINFTVYQLNVSALNEAYETLSKNGMTLTEKTDTTIGGTITVNERGRLFFSIPADKGWKLWVNGEETQIETFKDAFISVSLEPGEYEIYLKYETPLLREGAIISAVSLAALVALLLLRNKGKRGKNEQEVS